MMQDKKDRTAGRVQDRRGETRQVVGRAGQAGGYRTYIDRGYSYTMSCVEYRGPDQWYIPSSSMSSAYRTQVEKAGEGEECSSLRPRTLPCNFYL